MNKNPLFVRMKLKVKLMKWSLDVVPRCAPVFWLSWPRAQLRRSDSVWKWSCWSMTSGSQRLRWDGTGGRSVAVRNHPWLPWKWKFMEKMKRWEWNKSLSLESAQAVEDEKQKVVDEAAAEVSAMSKLVEEATRLESKVGEVVGVKGGSSVFAFCGEPETEATRQQVVTFFFKNRSSTETRLLCSSHLQRQQAHLNWFLDVISFSWSFLAPSKAIQEVKDIRQGKKDALKNSSWPTLVAFLQHVPMALLQRGETEMFKLRQATPTLQCPEVSFWGALKRKELHSYEDMLVLLDLEKDEVLQFQLARINASFCIIFHGCVCVWSFGSPRASGEMQEARRGSRIPEGRGECQTAKNRRIASRRASLSTDRSLFQSCVMDICFKSPAVFQVEETKKAQEELKQRAKEARQQMRDLEKDFAPVGYRGLYKTTFSLKIAGCPWMVRHAPIIFNQFGSPPVINHCDEFHNQPINQRINRLEWRS